MAFSATHFLETGFTFAVVYGCTERVEQYIVDRLTMVAQEDAAQAAHPILLPEIFAELERCRLSSLVQESNQTLETELMALNDYEKPYWKHGEEITNLGLNTTHLQNGLESWKVQLGEMVLHLDELTSHHFSHSDSDANQIIRDQREFREDDYFDLSVTDDDAQALDQALSTIHRNQSGCRRCTIRALYEVQCEKRNLANKAFTEEMKRVSKKTRNHLREMIYEYDNDIRDCNMRVDGVKLVTSLNIAKSTKRDGDAMQRLTALSLLFLPSMFIAVCLYYESLTRMR